MERLSGKSLKDNDVAILQLCIDLTCKQANTDEGTRSKLMLALARLELGNEAYGN